MARSGVAVHTVLFNHHTTINVTFLSASLGILEHSVPSSVRGDGAFHAQLVPFGNLNLPSLSLNSICPDKILISRIQRRESPVSNLASLLASAVHISPIIHHADEVERPVDDNGRVTFNVSRPAFVVVNHVSIECQG